MQNSEKEQILAHLKRPMALIVAKEYERFIHDCASSLFSGQNIDFFPWLKDSLDAKMVREVTMPPEEAYLTWA